MTDLHYGEYLLREAEADWRRRLDRFDWLIMEMRLHRYRPYARVDLLAETIRQLRVVSSGSDRRHLIGRVKELGRLGFGSTSRLVPDGAAELEEIAGRMTEAEAAIAQARRRRDV